MKSAHVRSTIRKTSHGPAHASVQSQIISLKQFTDAAFDMSFFIYRELGQGLIIHVLFGRELVSVSGTILSPTFTVLGIISCERINPGKLRSDLILNA